MKNTPKIISFTLAFILTAMPIYSAHSQDTIHDFHRRLNHVYQQANKDTLLQQVIFSSLEVFTTYKIGTVIKSPDRKEIAAIAIQIKALENSSDTRIVPIQNQLSGIERRARISQLNRQLRALEGNIATRMGRGTAKFFVRGAQLLLVLDFGTRIFVLNTLDHKDPGVIPLKTLFCSEVDCNAAVYDILGQNPRGN